MGDITVYEKLPESSYEITGAPFSHTLHPGRSVSSAVKMYAQSRREANACVVTKENALPICPIINLQFIKKI